MRTFSTSVNSALAKKFGLNVKLFVGVKWTDDQEFFYSSETFTGAKKSLVQISGLETTKLVTGSGATQSVTITLSDTEGDLTDILNTVDIHKRPAKVYMGFDDVALQDSVALIEGEINSEMVWNDKARTLTFTILSAIEGRQFGFAIEDGLFEKVDRANRSTPWPFRFGETCAYPAIRVQNGISGILRIGQGVLDPTLDVKICQAQQIKCPLIRDPAVTTSQPSSEENLTLAQNVFNARVATDPFSVGPDDDFGQRLARPTNINGGTSSTGLTDDDDRPLIRDYECERGKFETLCQLLRDRANQLVFVLDTLSIIGGDEFPQGIQTQIRVDDVVYTGVFTGEEFAISSTNRLDQPTANVDCQNIIDPYLGYRETFEPTPANLAACSESTSVWELRVIGGAGDAWRALGDLDNSSFKWIPAGTDVHLESRSTQVHIASLVPGTVTGVFAYRTLGDTRQLTELPTDYYEIVTTDYGDLSAEEIWLVRPLSSYPDEDWNDTIYATFDSDVGPSPVDAIEWIIERYTDFTVDAANFAAVKTLLTNYPCNYYHGVKENVLATVNRIAREARCALTVTDNVVKLTYLPLEPSVDKTFTSADLVNGTFQFNLSRTEELITSNRVEWEPWGASVLQDDEFARSFTVENNVEKYGFFGTGEVYRTINNEPQALKTATFWSIRESNTWKEVKFQTTLEHMNLELFDCVQLTVPVFPTIKCIITGMNIDPTQGTVEFIAWTPILSGTTGEYFFAWPSDLPNVPYPLDNYEIDAPALVVTPPEDHPLYIANPDPIVAPTTGDRFPSDVDDEFPETVCQDMTQSDLIDAIEPIFNRIGFPTDTGQQATRADEVANDGPSFNFEPPEDIEVCGRPSFEDCVWEVTVGYATATLIAKVNNPGAMGFDCGGILPGACGTQDKGQACGGPIFNRCKIFGSELMAQAYVGAIQGQIQSAYCSWRVGKQGPVYVIGPIKKDATGEAESCVGMGNTEAGNTTFDPSGLT